MRKTNTLTTFEPGHGLSILVKRYSVETSLKVIWKKASTPSFRQFSSRPKWRKSWAITTTCWRMKMASIPEHIIAKTLGPKATSYFRLIPFRNVRNYQVLWWTFSCFFFEFKSNIFPQFFFNKILQILFPFIWVDNFTVC